jgi:DNA mismatch endonuclease (patch repair protein)
MSRIRGTDTKPELAVRRLLYRMGYRFRLHSAGLPGKPDIVLRKHNTIIFVHGCFWHRHRHCKYAYTPKSRPEFWQQKFAGNIKRDRKNMTALAALGWKVITIWECEITGSAQLGARLRREIGVVL